MIEMCGLVFLLSYLLSPLPDIHVSLPLPSLPSAALPLPTPLTISIRSDPKQNPETKKK